MDSCMRRNNWVYITDGASSRDSEVTEHWMWTKRGHLYSSTGPAVYSADDFVSHGHWAVFSGIEMVDYYSVVSIHGDSHRGRILPAAT